MADWPLAPEGSPGCEWRRLAFARGLSSRGEGEVERTQGARRLRGGPRSPRRAEKLPAWVAEATQLDLCEGGLTGTGVEC